MDKNTEILMRHVSKQLGCITRIYGSKEMSSHIYSSVYGLIDPVIGQKALLDDMLSRLGTVSDPRIIFINNCLAYAAIYCPEYVFIIGPIRLSDTATFRESFDGFAVDPDWLITVPICRFESLIDNMLLFYNLHHGDSIDKPYLLNCVSDPSSFSDSVNIKLTEDNTMRHENQLLHNPYAQELHEMHCIETGDVNALRECWNVTYGENYGQLSKDRNRNIKNLCISVLTLASRAAIRGGVKPEHSFSLVDSYIRAIEEARSIHDVPQLTCEAEIAFTRMVAEQRNRSHSSAAFTDYISKCEDYIHENLHTKIQIKDIADRLGLNANYLSELYKAKTGQTIGEYILLEKIEQAKNLLVYSTYSYIEIANLLAFSSQSYLGTVFKKETGMTLKQYRDAYR